MANINDIKKNDIKKDDINKANAPKTDSVRDLSSKNQNQFKNQSPGQSDEQSDQDDENLVLDTAGGEMPDPDQQKSSDKSGRPFSKDVDKQNIGQKEQSPEQFKEKKAV